MADDRRGIGFGIAAYALWGLFPLYWPLLEPAGAAEILAHRIVWSLLTMAVVVVLLGRRRQVRAILASRRTTVLLVLAACTVTINWATYIWGVNDGRVVETSLGYFINPLVTVLMGVLILGERLRRVQWVAMGVASLAVVVLTVDYGRPPWLALVLAFSFAVYGLAKKTAGVGPVDSLAFETAVVAPFALGYLLFLGATGVGAFTAYGVGYALLLTTAGVVTAVPLLLFGAAANRIPLVLLGMLQYLAPVLQFALGLLIFDEAMPPVRWIGFGLVWLALVMFTVEATRHHRHQLRLTALAAAA